MKTITPLAPAPVCVLVCALVCALASPLVPTAVAAPAPWYHWISKSTAERVCSQTPLGAGWARGDGPYRDARCEKRVPAK